MPGGADFGTRLTLNPWVDCFRYGDEKSSYKGLEPGLGLFGKLRVTSF